MDSFDEILHIRLKVRQNSARREVSSRMRDQMMTWNLLDTNLYNHFNKTLDSKVRAVECLWLHFVEISGVDIFLRLLHMGKRGWAPS